MTDHSKIRVLVTDDSAFMRRSISTMISSHAELEVVGKACDGLEAIEMAKQLHPDLITLDIEMPQMDGLTALRQLKRVCRAKILMVSSLTTAGSVAALTALRYGASDFIAKDASQISLNIVKIEQDLVEKIRAIAKPGCGKGEITDKQLSSTPVHHDLNLRAGQFDCITIGSSTGGPPVLEQIMAVMPAQMPLPIVVAQHMPKIFTETMSERLNELSPLNVLHADNGMPLLPHHVYITPGGMHSRIKKGITGKLRLEISTHPADALFKPSVNELFRSAATACGSRCLGIVLTGMGEDGLEGARELHSTGGTLLAQDSESCVVYGMPKAVTQAALVNASLTPTQIIHLLSQFVAPTLASSTAR